MQSADPPQRSAGQKVRVLVVDDSAYNRQTITAMLEADPDVEVIGRASNGKEALRQAFDLMPDVITLDLEMPEMDGFAFLRLLMAKRPLPVIVISSHSERDNVFRALELGAMDFVAKPGRHIGPDLLRRGGARRELTVWSAGCSTGEEAYTIAMLLADVAPELAPQILGTDISPKVIAAAQQAVYSAASFRTTSDDLRERHFEPAGPGLWRVAPALRRTCNFVRHNLTEVDRYAAFGRHDVIFCRNVLMYLSSQARLRIVEGFYDALVPGGYLLLGHSESLLSLSTRFDLVNLTSDLVYRRSA
jgi:chemotaxis methyl-accepting protein methylase